MHLLFGSTIFLHAPKLEPKRKSHKTGLTERLPSGNKNITTIEIKNLNHLFQTCVTGLPEEYEEIDESFSPAVMKKMVNWLEKGIVTKDE